MRPGEKHVLGPDTDHAVLIKAFIDLEWSKLDSTETCRPYVDRKKLLKAFIDPESDKLNSTDSVGQKPDTDCFESFLAFDYPGVSGFR